MATTTGKAVKPTKFSSLRRYEPDQVYNLSDVVVGCNLSLCFVSSFGINSGTPVRRRKSKSYFSANGKFELK